MQIIVTSYLNVRNRLTFLAYCSTWHSLETLSALAIDRRGTDTSLLDKFRVEKHEALVHDLERGSHLLVVVGELHQDVLGFALRQLDQKTFGRLDVVSSNKKVGVVGRDFNYVVALPELFTSLVEHNSVFVQVLSLPDHGQRRLLGRGASTAGLSVSTADAG